MKSVAYIVLFFFLSFLSLPTIVFVLDNDETDVSIVYNTSEEEEVHKTFHFKACFKSYKDDYNFDIHQLASKNVILKKRLLYDSILEEIYSPPPEI
ncbi:hypothetical protein [Flavobacterium filum]|uniref:hypothetical protein n=1 Tax=Flavobacterium TaxID=237 RepID=UPI0003FF75C2|nr:hypothetical protein [Flavobacterium filum]